MALNIRKHVDSLELRLRTADNLGHDLGYRGNVRRVDIVGQVVLGTSASQTREVCPNMKKVTLEKILDVLENETNEVILNDEFMQKALSPLEKMLELAK